MSTDQNMQPLVGDTDLPAYKSCTGPGSAAYACQHPEASQDAPQQRGCIRSSKRGAEEEKRSMGETEDSPGHLSVNHMNLDFEECFREHKSTTTHPKIYAAMRVTFKYTKLFVYNVVVFVIGMKLVFLFAIFSALFNFLLVWVWGPVLKTIVVATNAIAPALTVPLQAICNPLADVGGRVFRQIHIKTNVGRAETILHV